MKYIFLHTARKLCAVRPAGEKQSTHFTLLVKKISICTTGVSKESARSHICDPRLRLDRQLSICDLRRSLLLLPRWIIYYVFEKQKNQNQYCNGCVGEFEFRALNSFRRELAHYLRAASHVCATSEHEELLLPARRSSHLETDCARMHMCSPRLRVVLPRFASI